MEGHPVQILHATSTGFELDVAAIQNILLHENVRNKKVSVLSVAGDFRKGKSFLLNFMLRYLDNKGSDHWLGNPDEPLTGFDWRGGHKSNTTGILMWSKVFVVKTDYGEEVAVILMDTQGTSDSESTMKQSATVFALSSMVSSVQVFNLSQHIKESDLQFLQIFTEYGRLAYETDKCDAPFQKLLFLIRDWQNPDDLEYGFHGGEEYLKHKLRISSNQPAELRDVREHIKKYIKEVSCFLMPHPGSAVSTQSTFDGRLSGIEDQFKQQLTPLMHETLSPNALIVKEIYGKKLTAGELFEYFKSFGGTFESNKLPTPMTIFESTAKANNEVAISEAKNHYKTIMDKICYPDRKSFTEVQLRAEHSIHKQSAVELFQKTKKMGTESFCAKYKDILIKLLDDMFKSYRESNELKLRNEQQEIKHRKETEELHAKIEEVKKSNEETMKNNRIAFEKQKEDFVEQMRKEKKMSEQQIAEITEQFTINFEEEQEKLHKEREKYEQKIAEMAAQMDRSNEYNKKEVERLHDELQKSKNDLEEKANDIRMRRQQKFLDVLLGLVPVASNIAWNLARFLKM